MPAIAHSLKLPEYQGGQWLDVTLPHSGKPWHAGKSRGRHKRLVGVLEQAAAYSAWQWPKRPLFFLADPHADYEAFINSLVASLSRSWISRGICCAIACLHSCSHEALTISS